MNYIQKGFSNFLKQINTNGAIKSCVLEVKNKSFHVEAIDETNTLIVIASTKKSKLLEKDLKDILGLPDITVLIKFFSTMKSPKIQLDIKDNRIIFTSKDKSRKLNYLLADSKAITTVIIKDDPKINTKKTLMDMQTKRVELTEDILTDFQAYISMSTSKSVNIKHVRLKDLTIRIGEEITSQFIITIPKKGIKYLEKNNESTDLNFDGDYIQKVFSSIDFDSDNPPILYFSKNSPIIIEHGNTIWAINPQIEE